MTARARWATGYARRVITELGIEAPPVKVEAIALHYGVEIREEFFPDDISGALHRGLERAVIAVNKGHHAHRRRFTIAHELGHFLLHRDAPPTTTRSIRSVCTFGRRSRTRSGTRRRSRQIGSQPSC